MKKLLSIIISVLVFFCILPNYSFGTLPNSALYPSKFIESHIFDIPAKNANQKDQLNRKKQHSQRKASGDLTISYGYDAEGNLTGMTDAKGQVFTYAYDAINRQTGAAYPAVTIPFLTLQQVATTYDANNNVVSVTETKRTSGGGTVTDVTSNTYDDFDRLQMSTQRGMTVSYDYDANGNRTGVATANGSTTYTFDTRNRLATATAGGQTTTYTYTPAGRPETVGYPNGTGATYTYHPSSRVETVTHRAGEALISKFAYIYDQNGNRFSQIEQQGETSETTAYAYDNLDRLKSFTVTGGGVTTATAYTFDGYNRKSETVKVIDEGSGLQNSKTAGILVR